MLVVFLSGVHDVVFFTWTHPGFPFSDISIFNPVSFGVYACLKELKKAVIQISNHHNAGVTALKLCLSCLLLVLCVCACATHQFWVMCCHPVVAVPSEIQLDSQIN